MRRLPAAAAIAVATLLTVGPAVAGPPGRDGAFNFRFGGFFPTGDSEFWKTNEAAFTLDHSDFRGGIGGIGYTASITNYFEFDVNADFYAASSRSADLIPDENGFPILHDTRLSILPVTFGFRVLPAGRYARRGPEGRRRHVRRPAPYIGAGVGMAYWQYEEEGDFVFVDPSSPTGFSIFYDRLKDTGLEFETHVMVGIEFPVAPEWNFTLEVRQSWAEATPDEFALVNPGKLDLGGTSVFLGGSVRF